MAIEIERKFLVKNDSWREGAQGQKYMQGYMSRGEVATVRVRITEKGAFLTIKGKPAVQDSTISAAKLEFEYPVPIADAREMLNLLCQGPIIEKTRYCIEHNGMTWEVDEFYGKNAGLVMAEVELETEDQDIIPPTWIGREVTSDKRYYNASLSEHSYSEWKDGEAPA